jgi:hypothetical protein
MNRDFVFRGHLQEHASKPVFRDRGEQVRQDRQLGTAEGGGDGVAAERNGVSRRDVRFIAGRKPIGQESDVDVGLTNEERLHRVSIGMIPATRPRLGKAVDINRYGDKWSLLLSWSQKIYL